MRKIFIYFLLSFYRSGDLICDCSVVSPRCQLFCNSLSKPADKAFLPMVSQQQKFTNRDTSNELTKYLTSYYQKIPIKTVYRNLNDNLLNNETNLSNFLSIKDNNCKSNIGDNLLNNFTYQTAACCVMPQMSDLNSYYQITTASVNNLEKDFSRLECEQSRSKFLDRKRTRRAVIPGEVLNSILTKKILECQIDKKMSRKIPVTKIKEICNFIKWLDGHSEKIKQKEKIKSVENVKNMLYRMYQIEALECNDLAKKNDRETGLFFGGISFSKITITTTYTPYYTSYITEYPKMSYLRITKTLSNFHKDNFNEYENNDQNEDILSLSNSHIKKKNRLTKKKTVNVIQDYEDNFIFDDNNIYEPEFSYITKTFYSTEIPTKTILMTEYPLTSYITITESFIETPLETKFEKITEENMPEITTVTIYKTVTARDKNNSYLDNDNIYDNRDIDNKNFRNCLDCERTHFNNILSMSDLKNKTNNEIKSKSSKFDDNIKTTTVYNNNLNITSNDQTFNKANSVDTIILSQNNSNKSIASADTQNVNFDSDVEFAKIINTTKNNEKGFVVITDSSNLKVLDLISSLESINSLTKKSTEMDISIFSTDFKNNILSSISSEKLVSIQKSSSEINLISSISSSIFSSLSYIFDKKNDEKIEKLRTMLIEEIEKRKKLEENFFKKENNISNNVSKSISKDVLETEPSLQKFNFNNASSLKTAKNNEKQSLDDKNQNFTDNELLEQKNDVQSNINLNDSIIDPKAFIKNEILLDNLDTKKNSTIDPKAFLKNETLLDKLGTDENNLSVDPEAFVKETGGNDISKIEEKKDYSDNDNFSNKISQQNHTIKKNKDNVNIDYSDNLYKTKINELNKIKDIYFQLKKEESTHKNIDEKENFDIESLKFLVENITKSSKNVLNAGKTETSLDIETTTEYLTKTIKKENTTTSIEKSTETSTEYLTKTIKKENTTTSTEKLTEISTKNETKTTTKTNKETLTSIIKITETVTISSIKTIDFDKLTTKSEENNENLESTSQQTLQDLSLSVILDNLKSSIEPTTSSENKKSSILNLENNTSQTSDIKTESIFHTQIQPLKDTETNTDQPEIKEKSFIDKIYEKGKKLFNIPDEPKSSIDLKSNISKSLNSNDIKTIYFTKTITQIDHKIDKSQKDFSDIDFKIKNTEEKSRNTFSKIISEHQEVINSITSNFSTNFIKDEMHKSSTKTKLLDILKSVNDDKDSEINIENLSSVFNNDNFLSEIQEPKWKSKIIELFNEIEEKNKIDAIEKEITSNINKKEFKPKSIYTNESNTNKTSLEELKSDSFTKSNSFTSDLSLSRNNDIESIDFNTKNKLNTESTVHSSMIEKSTSDDIDIKTSIITEIQNTTSKINNRSEVNIAKTLAVPIVCNHNDMKNNIDTFKKSKSRKTTIITHTVTATAEKIKNNSND
ncbi:hypothetical protein GVAV_000286 [Gurleya vavrai]